MKNVCHLGDCMEHMRGLPDNYYSLGIIDPPYGINQGGGNNKSRGKLALSKTYKDFGDDNSPDYSFFEELLRISSNTIIWGANHFISKIPIDSSCWIVWDKLNGRTDFADCEIAWTSFKTSVRAFRFRWQGMIQGNMSEKENRIHPTQKPVALYKWLLANYAKPGDTIFDSHVGSGSIRIACHDLDFDFEGCEIDADYHAAQEARFQKHCDQLRLKL